MFVYYDWPFVHVCILQENIVIIFHFNSWLSFQQLCSLLLGSAMVPVSVAALLLLSLFLIFLFLLLSNNI